MKVAPEHLDVLRAAIAPFDTPERREAYREGRFPRAGLVQDIDKRYRWDLLWVALTNREGFIRDMDAHDAAYEHGYSDAHLDTALRTIVPALGLTPVA